DINAAAVNATARDSDVPVYICPSDPSTSKFNTADGDSGRSNYYGNMGITADAFSQDPATGGMFFSEFTATITANGNKPGTLRLKNITDGTSNTAMFAEI